jgi:hypothetical protein
MNALLPQPPTPERPYWRDQSGRRTTFLAIAAGCGRAERERLLGEHCEAVCRIIRAAATARLTGDAARARTLANRASRLCGELAGLWPAGSDEPLR